MALNLRFNKCLCVVSATEISRFIASVPCEISYSQRLSSAVAASEILEAASEACLIFFQFSSGFQTFSVCSTLHFD